MDYAISWYQSVVYSGQLTPWEADLKDSASTLANEASKRQNKTSDWFKKDYIDFDLVKGSTFTKTTPQPDREENTVLGCCIKTIFLPLNFSWWKENTNTFIASLCCFLYAVHFYTICYYLILPKTLLKFISFSEVCVPCLLLMFIIFVHCRLLSVDGSADDGISLPTDDSSTVLQEDAISVKIWDKGECQKVSATFIDLAEIIVTKAYTLSLKEDFSLWKTAMFLSASFLPFFYHIFGDTIPTTDYFAFLTVLCEFKNYRLSLVMMTSAILRIVFTAVLFIMLESASCLFQKKLYYAKFFAHLTSSRCARKSNLPHFRLNKVSKIKTWLFLRSYLRRKGPQRFTDAIFSSMCTAFIITLCSILCPLLDDSPDTFLASALYWELATWCMIFAYFLLKYSIIETKIQKKYDNSSILLTEQFNLYLQIEKKPDKKDDLKLIHKVIGLTSKLIRENKNQIKVFGLSMDSLLYNVVKIVTISAISGGISELLGVKVKVWKLKT